MACSNGSSVSGQVVVQNGAGSVAEVGAGAAGEEEAFSSGMKVYEALKFAIISERLCGRAAVAAEAASPPAAAFEPVNSHDDGVAETPSSIAVFPLPTCNVSLFGIARSRLRRPWTLEVTSRELASALKVLMPMHRMSGARSEMETSWSFSYIKGVRKVVLKGVRKVVLKGVQE